MASVLSRLASLFPSYRRAYAPAAETPEERADRLVAATRAAIEQSRRRPRPSTGEKVPANYHGGVAGKVWFLPFADSTTHDTPEIRAAMRRMRADGYVKAAWEPQILTVASEDWQVQASEAGNAESEEQAAAVKTMVEDYVEGGMPAIVRAVCAPFGSEGHSLAEPVWNPGRKGKLEKHIVCTKLAAKDTDPTTGHVRLSGDQFNSVKWVQARRAEGQPTYPIDEFVFSRYLTVFDEALGEAAFRPAYGKYWMRDTVSKLRIIHTEKRMAGMLQGTYQNDDDKPALEEALAAAKSATWIAVPEGVKIEAIGLSTASEPDYRSFDESLRDEIVIAIAFATLQVLTASGPQLRGDSEVQKSMADLGPWLLMALVCEAVNKQLIPKYIDYNYPYPAGGGYPKLTFGAASNPELLELGQVIQVAQGIGFTGEKALSAKHYAKAFSLQLADPNDPSDRLDPSGGQGSAGGGTDPMAALMGGGGGMGGLPPGPDGGGDPSAGGVPAAPNDPWGGGAAGGAEGFAERGPWDCFAWTDWKPRGDRMVSPSGKRTLTMQAFQRLSSRTPKVPTGRRPRRSGTATATGAGGSGAVPAPAPAEPPKAPAAPEPPAVPKAPAPPGAPAPGGKARVKKAAGAVAGAVASGAKATLKAKLAAARLAGKGAARAGAGTVWAGAKVAQGVAYVQDKLGAVLQRVPVLESAFGVGTGLRKAAQRQMQAARNTALLAATGRRGAAAKRAATGLSSYLDVKFRENTKRFGLVRGIAIEGAILGLKLAGLAGAGAAAVALTGAAPLSVGGLLTGASGASAAGAAAFAAKNVIKSVLNPLIRAAVEYPFRYGKGRRGSGSAVRAAGAAMDASRARDLAGPAADAGPGLLSRAKRTALLKTRGPGAVARAEKRAKAKAAAAGMVAAPGAAVTAARGAMNRVGGRDFVPTGGRTTSRRRFYSEAFAFAEAVDPMDLVAAFREQLDQVAGAPVDLTDEQLASLLAELLEYADDYTAETGDARAEAFAERLGELSDAMTDAEWEAFGWQAARSRGKSGIKAVGTGPDANKPPKYGDDARAVLARQQGVSRRATAPRTLTFEQVGPRGGVRRTVERGVSAERARQVIVEQALADVTPGPHEPGRRRLVKVNRTRLRKAVRAKATELEAAAAQAANDPAAAKTVADAGKQAAEAAAAELKKLGPLPPEARPVIRSTWLAAAKGLPKGQRKEVATLLDSTLGQLERDAGAAGELTLKLGAYLGKLPAGAARLAVGALGRFAVGLVTAAAKIPRTAKRLGSEAANDLARAISHDRETASNLIQGAAGGAAAVARGALAVPKTLAGYGADAAYHTAIGLGQGLFEIAKETLRMIPRTARAGWAAAKWLANSQLGRAARPFLWWGAALVGGAAVMAAPVLAAGAGLIPPVAGFLSAPLAVAGAVALGRKLGRKAADAGMEATGNGAIVPHDPEPASAPEPAPQPVADGVEQALRAARRRIEAAVKPRADGTYDTAEADRLLADTGRQIDALARSDAARASELAVAATGNEPEDAQDAARLLKAWVAQTLNALDGDGADPLDRPGRGGQRWTLSERGGRVFTFGWGDWKRKGDRMVSASGQRSLSLESFQRLSAGHGGAGAGTGQPKPAQNIPNDIPPEPRPKLAPPANPQPGRVYQIAPGHIAVDPGRFQFKLNTNDKGVGAELANVTRYDPELAGVLAVWRDPADGKSYVVNGHHRLELANRTGAKEVSARYVTAKTAEEARAKGALINIAEGRGTAVDAAKFMRDTGRSAADLAQAGISLKGQVARDAADLTKLAPDLFRQVAHGTLDADRATAVARHLDDHLDQQRLLSALARQEERTGRVASPRVVEAMAQEMRDAPKLATTRETLFGPIEQDESVYFHRAELKSYIRAELAKEARDFRLGSSVRRAAALEAAGGNQLATEQNRKIADRADAALDDFDRGARLKGPLSDLLNDYATEYADASNAGRSQLRQKALAAVRAVLSGNDPGAAPVVAKRGPGLFD